MKQEYTMEFTQLIQKLRTVSSRMWESRELSEAEFAALIAIRENTKSRKNQYSQEISTSDVARHMGSTLSAVSKLIRNLSIKGYVKQVPGQYDRGEMHPALTQKGEEYLNQSLQKRHEAMGDVFDQYGEEKTEQLIKLLGEIVDLMENESEV